MSKFLIDKGTDVIRSTHEHPMNFSISGKYVIDVPTSLQVKAETDLIVDLIAEKIARFQALHPTLPTALNDELLATPNIDTTIGISERYITGPNKRTAILPGGFVWTNPIPTTTFTTVFAHWFGFTLYSDTSVVGPDGPLPSPLLYNFNPISSQFEDFLFGKFKVDLYDAAGTVFIATLVGGIEQSATFSGTDILLRFENLDPDRTWHLSDWLLLHN